ncbi:hypothetical protein ACIQYS_15845 [Psychrobacillus sp. NPDC096426]|uniref:hypothetical protein n=1 Tax=Psychrobacillus sp. NPDC096426 TaxID=3364491 RepID=UPI003808A67C
MVNLNRESVIERAFDKSTTKQVIAYLKSKKPGWVRDKKKQKNKTDLKVDFLSLSQILNEKDINDLVVMSVMKKNRGLPAYTYKTSNLGKLKDKSLQEMKDVFVKSYSQGGGYEVVLNDIEYSDEKYNLYTHVKEYETSWKTGVQDVGSISAVYNCKIIIDVKESVVSIEVGDDHIEGIIVKFLGSRLGLPIVPYTITVFNAVHSDSASEKTMLIFDYIYNRLPLKGISSSFNDVKFAINSTTQTGGVKGVTIHGNDIISSDEACKYITLANDIISFKTTSLYKGSKVTVQFTLKGKQFDKLKITVMDNMSETLKQEIMGNLQTEYILMCKQGIKDMAKTRLILQPIYESFINKASIS